MIIWRERQSVYPKENYCVVQQKNNTVDYKKKKNTVELIYRNSSIKCKP